MTVSSTAATGADSLVSYYKDLQFNPVLIRVEDSAVWKAHFDKRRNLYEHHLGLPLPYLQGASVLEFGPNSGENALLPALFGARLTLVEPNHQVLPRLRDLFKRFGVSSQIQSLHCSGIEEFQSDDSFDLVIAEGFLYTLPNRDQVLRKIASLVRPGRFGIVSYNDRCGGLLEYLRRALLFRCCELAGVADVQSDACLDLARTLYSSDFARLGLTRTFEAWWRDTLVNPFCRSQHTWSLPELLSLLHQQGCEFHSSSPAWFTGHLYTWYKNVPSAEDRRQQVHRAWSSNLAYFLTGLRPNAGVGVPADDKLIQDVSTLVGSLCDWVVESGRAAVQLRYPDSLDRYLRASGNHQLRNVNEEWQKLFAALHGTSLPALQQAYAQARLSRQLWGTAYHYLCFQRGLDKLEQAAPAPAYA